MPRSKRKAADIRALAAQLLARIDEAEPGLADRLRADVIATIATRSDVTVVFADDQIRSECSIAAAYLRNHVPPRIALRHTFSRGRQLFSAAHEFCHHLIDRDAQIADILFDEPDGGGQLEEDICDAFAAMLLISDLETEQALEGGGVTAAALIRLFQSTSASREAAAVSLVQRLETEGYVAILRIGADIEEGDDETVSAQFCARAGAAFPLARMALQDDTLFVQAMRAGRARGNARLRFPSGAYTDEYHADVVRVGQYLFAVLVADTPPWGGLSVRSASGGGHDDAWCENCSNEFRPLGAPCRGCGEHECPQCRRCSCEAAPPPSARVCNQCFLESPGSRFVGDRCADCAGVD